MVLIITASYRFGCSTRLDGELFENAAETILEAAALGLKRIREQRFVTEDLADPVTVGLVTATQHRIEGSPEPLPRQANTKTTNTNTGSRCTISAILTHRGGPSDKEFSHLHGSQTPPAKRVV